MTVPKRILITGGSGLLGSRLARMLKDTGFEVRQLNRSNPQQSADVFLWDGQNGTMDARALEGVGAIIHLAGANVADKRWTPARKDELIRSRVDSTDLLFKTLSSIPHNVKTFISASAIGFYGTQDTKVLTETDPAGKDFLAQLTNLWEESVKKIEVLGIRTIRLRIGVVLSTKGGALKPIADTVRFYIGSPLGSGEQNISWIHEDDACRIFIHCLQNENLSGVFNAVAPTPVTNRELTKEVAHVLQRPLILPKVPALGLRLLFGEMADIVISGNRVSAAKIIGTGFSFQYPLLKEALIDLLKR